MASSAGSAIRTTAPETPRPRRKVRRERAVAAAILSSSSQECFRADDTDDKTFESEFGVLKFAQSVVDHRLVGGRLRPAQRIAEQLFHDALPARGIFRQEFA